MIAMAVWMLAMCGGARRGVHDVDGLVREDEAYAVRGALGVLFEGV